MRITKLTLAIAIALIGTLAVPAHAEVVYTPVYMSVPVGGESGIDIDHDGVTDFTLKSHLLEYYCQFGDGYLWNLTFIARQGNAVVVDTGDYAAALTIGQPVNSGQEFYQGESVMTRLYWGFCGAGVLGQWLNLPNRYLGFQFRGAGVDDVHYGWAKVSDIAYVDQYNRLHASVILLGFAYETISGKAILTGQTSEADHPRN